MSGFQGFLGKVGLVVATSVVTATLAGTGVASAVAAVPNNSVNSLKIVDNTVRSIDVRNGTLRGVDIADGTVGPDDVEDNSLTASDIAEGGILSEDIRNGTIHPGDLALDALTRWAKVDADASPQLLAGRGASTVTRPAAGNYVVTFNAPITGCGWTATLNDDDAGAASPGEISVERNNANEPNVLRIRTFDSAGALVDGDGSNGFTVMVNC